MFMQGINQRFFIRKVSSLPRVKGISCTVPTWEGGIRSCLLLTHHTKTGTVFSCFSMPLNICHNFQATEPSCSLSKPIDLEISLLVVGIKFADLKAFQQLYGLCHLP